MRSICAPLRLSRSCGFRSGLHSLKLRLQPLPNHLKLEQLKVLPLRLCLQLDMLSQELLRVGCLLLEEFLRR